MFNETAPANRSINIPLKGAADTSHFKVSISALLSFLFGLLSYLLIPIIPAIILGIIALSNIKKSNGILRGRGLAIAGLSLGLVFMLVFGLLALALAFSGSGYKGMVANETSAVAGLRQLMQAEAIWKTSDPDRNSIADYWTYDLSCFYRLCGADNTTRLSLIGISLARADYAPADYAGGQKPFGDLYIESWSAGWNYRRACQGYYFQVITNSEQDGPYCRTLAGANKIPVGNTGHFAFQAFPASYAQTGVRTFIANETGAIYATDTCGIDGGRINKWPGVDPELVTGPGGQRWRAIN